MLVVEGDWFERENRFACLVHCLDRVLETRRGCGRAEMTVAVYDNCYTCWNGCPTDAGDQCRPVSCLHADANSSEVARNTEVADIDIVTARGEVSTG